MAFPENKDPNHRARLRLTKASSGHSGATGVLSNEVLSQRERLELLEIELCVLGRLASLFLGAILVLAGLFVAVNSLMDLGDLVAPIGLIGGGTGLIRFGGRPPDVIIPEE